MDNLVDEPDIIIGNKSKYVITLGLMLIIFFVSAQVIDQLLGLLGYPADFVIPVVHPQNYVEFRDFIDYKYTFRTNSQGLRYREIPLEKSKNNYRVFVVGDSFIEGIGVENDETLPAYLELEFSSAVQDVNFINGGLAGAGPIQYGRVLFSVGKKYQPDAVLINLYANDLSNLTLDTKPEDMFIYTIPDKTDLEGFFHFLYPRTYTIIKTISWHYSFGRSRFTTDFISTISAEARRRGIPDDQIDTWKARVPKNLVRAVEQGRYYGAPLAYGLLSPNYYTDALDISSDEAQVKWEILVSVLTEMVSHSRDLGLEVAITFSPERLQYDPNQHNSSNIWYQVGMEVRQEWLTTDTEVQVRLKEWAKAHQVPYLDLTPILRNAVRESSVPLTWHYDNHWNAKGNRVVARAIAEWIKEERVFNIQ